MGVSDVSVVLAALPRLLHACRTRSVRVAEGERAVSEHQARILTYLDPEDPVMVTELAEYAGVTASTMSLTLSRLEEGGFVTRLRDPDDRRVMNVRLTDRGVQVRDRFSALDPGRVDAMLALMRPAQRRRALEGLSLLTEAADTMISRTDEYVASLTGAGS